MPQQFTSWSYSRFRDHSRCPAFAKYKYLDKLPEPGSPQMERGTAIHKMAEDYALGKLKTLPKELSLFKHHFAAIKGRKTLSVEQMWCFDQQWGERQWNDWNNVWLRVKVDLCDYGQHTDNIAVAVDHKTGKYRENEIGSYLEQMEITALGCLLKYPTADAASPRMWYLDEGVEYPEKPEDAILYPRAELPRLIKKWEKKVRPMFVDTQFKATPNDKCKWCHFRAANGGPCKF